MYTDLGYLFDHLFLNSLNCSIALKPFIVINYGLNIMNLDKNVKIGKLCCLSERRQGKVFFSLVDYRNTYFSSRDTNKIIEFYDGFENREQLINWMKERPKGVTRIVEIEDKKEIIVVIPTADFYGKYAKECRENIFKGLHIIFVESGGRQDFYFNIAHNVNAGIRKALEYNPKWIIFSGDDMYKMDNISVLINQLTLLDETKFSAVFTKESSYHSISASFARPRVTSIFVRLIDKKFKVKNRLKTIFTVSRLERKFKCKYLVTPKRGFAKFMYNFDFDFISFTDFGIFSATYVKSHSGVIYDERFINAQEDHDIMIDFFLEKLNYTFIDYKIGDFVGSTLGNEIDRSLREIAGISYLNYKYSSKI